MSNDRGISFGKKSAASATADFRNHRAYVIGINAYRNGIPALRTAANDAKRIGELLNERHGYTVKSFPRDAQPTLANLRDLLHKTMPDEVGPDDSVLVYFAGHGIALDGEDGPEGYLVPEDASQEENSYLKMTEMNDALSQLKCRHLLLILDCCFAGAFRWSGTRDISTIPRVIHRERYERFVRSSAWQVITSAAYDQKALDVLWDRTIGKREESTDHSPFAAALFRALEGRADTFPAGEDGKPCGDGLVTATELYQYLREDVESATESQHTRQTPGLWPLKKHDKGEYILLTPGRELKLPPAPELNSANNPYRGLQSFDEEQASLFFGRTRFVATLADRVLAQSLTIVLGASGTGKSSVVKAGLVPLLRNRDADAWQVLPPIRPGRSPLAVLAALVLPGESDDPEAIADRLTTADSNENALADRFTNWAKQTSPPTRLLIVFDQFEELLTLCWDVTEREQFLVQVDRALAACGDRLRIVLTLRSDFEPQFSDSPLKEEWLNARVVVPVMTLDEYREAIEGPATTKVLYFHGNNSSQSFIDRLIGDVANTPGALPLLSFTLSELYRRYLERKGDDRSLREEDYVALGGVGGSLRNQADKVYRDLPDDAHRETMKRVMLRMVSSEGGELARRRVPDEEYIYDIPEENDRVHKVIQSLTDARLVVEGKEFDEQPFVEPAHDELIRGWNRLLNWSREEQENLQLRRILTPASNDWKKGQGGLWHANPRLALLKRINKSKDSWLNATETSFVNRSAAKRKRILVGAISFVTVAFLVVAVLAVIAQKQAVIAQKQKEESESRLATSYFDKGADKLRENNYHSAVAWFFQAFETAPSSQSYESSRTSARALIGAWIPLIGRPLLHDHYVTSVSFSPDSKTALTGSQDCTARLWSVATGGPLGKPMTHKSTVNSVAFSPTGDTVVTGSDDETARLWNAVTGDPLGEIMKHQGPVRAVSFSPKGDKVVTASDDTTARLWDAGTGKQIGTMKHDNVVYAVAFSPDGKTVLTGSKDDTACLWDADTSIQLGEPMRHDDSVYAVAFSPDGKIALTGSYDDTARLWNAGTGKQIGTMKHDNMVYAVAFSLDGKTVLTGSEDDTARLWDADTGSQLGEPMRHDDFVSAVAFSPDGKFALTGSYDDTVRLWDAKNGKPIRQYSHNHPVVALTFSPDGKTILTGSQDMTARLWDVDSENQFQLSDRSHDNHDYTEEVSPKGNLTVKFDKANKTLRILNVVTGKQIGHNTKYYADKGPPVAFSPKTNRVVIAGEDNTATLWDADSREKVTTMKHDDSVNAVVFSPDGTMFATGSGDDTVRLWDSATGKQRQLPLENDDEVNAVAFSPDGNALATGCRDEKVRLWDLNTGVLRRKFNHSENVNAVAFRHDGKTILSGGVNKTARLWRVPPVATEDPANLRLLVEVLTTFHFEQGGLTRFTQKEWLKKKEKLDRMQQTKFLQALP